MDDAKDEFQSAGPDLRPWVDFQALSGALTTNFRNIGKTTARKRGSSQTKVTQDNLTHGVVPVTLEDYYSQIPTDVFDQDTTNAPQEVSKLARIQARAVKRLETQQILDVLNAASFDTAHTIAAGAVGMTVSKIMQARQQFKALEIDEPLVLLQTEEQESDLILASDNKFTSADFSASQGSETGDVQDGHFGVSKYITIGSGRAETGLGKSGTTRDCYMFVRSAVGLAVGFNGALQHRVDWDLDNLTNVSTAFSRGQAAIIDALGIVKIQCKEVS